MMVGLCYWFCLNRKYGFLFGGFVPEKKEETQNKKQKKNSGTFKQVQHCHFLHFNKEGGSSVYKRKEKKKGGECYAQAFGRNNNCAKWCYNSTQFSFGFNLVDDSGLVFHRRRRR